MHNMLTPENVIFFGDWHANAPFAHKILKEMYYKHPEVDTYIHLGDFGINTFGFPKIVNNILTELNKTMLIIPGNHEDYNQIKEYPETPEGLTKVKNNLYILPRGYKWKWHNINFAALGGAFSIDKRYRTEGKTWFEDELITHEDYLNTINTDDDIDILLTHDTFKLPEKRTDDKLPWKLTRKEYNASKLCRDYIARVVFQKNVKINIHGHHHLRYNRIINDILIIGLNRDGKTTDGNYIKLNLPELRKELDNWSETLKDKRI